MISRPSRITISLTSLLIAFAIGLGMSMLGSQPGEAAQNQNIRVVDDFETDWNNIPNSLFPSSWGKSDCAASHGSYSAWATAFDAEENPVDCDGPYPDEVTSGLILAVDLEEFSADTPVLDLRYDFRLETTSGDLGATSGLLFLNVLQLDEEAGDITRITVHASHQDTQGRFEEVRIDLQQLQDVYDPERAPFSLAGETAYIEWLYFARPGSGDVPAGAFVDHVRLEYGDTRAPTVGPTISPTVTATTAPTDPSPSSTPTPDTPPTLVATAPRIFLPYLQGLDE
jgi:hypothetical protein